MGTLLKLFLVAVLALPTGAFVVGRLSAGEVQVNPERAPVVLDDPVISEPQQTITGPDPRPDDGPRSRPVEVIGPRPTELDDDLHEDPPGNDDDEGDGDDREPGNRGPGSDDGDDDRDEDRDDETDRDDDRADRDREDDEEPDDDSGSDSSGSGGGDRDERDDLDDADDEPDDD